MYIPQQADTILPSVILFCCSPSLFGNYLVIAYYTIKWYDLFVGYFDSRVPHQGYKNEWTAQPLSDFVFYLVDEEMDLVKHRNRQEYGSTLGEKRWRLRWKMSFKGQGWVLKKHPGSQTSCVDFCVDKNSVVVSNVFYFHPDPWGDDRIWRAYFCLMGWNHQLENQNTKLIQTVFCSLHST